MSKDYFDNNKLVPLMVDWKQAILDAKSKNLPEPEMPRDLQLAILSLSKNLSNRFNFVNYSYRDMIEGDMIECLVKYGKNFDPEKGKNLFGYWSMFAFRAGIQRIKKEKLQQKIKVRIIKEMDIHDLLESEDEENIAEFKEYIANYISSKDYDEEVYHKPIKRTRKHKNDDVLDKLFAFVVSVDEQPSEDIEGSGDNG